MYVYKTTIFRYGDFNTDLLIPNKHKITDEFINTMDRMSLFPKITSPSRITSLCVTIVDNIFTNGIENNTVNGLLINDISDHPFLQFMIAIIRLISQTSKPSTDK